SFSEPTWYQVLTATMGALWSSCTSRVSPFLSTNLVYLMSGMGMFTPAVDVAFLAGAAGLACELRINEPKLTAASASTALAGFCLNLFFQGAPQRKSTNSDRRRPEDNS